MKKVCAIAVLLAVAAIPIIIIAKDKKQVPPVASDANDIFEWELSSSSSQ